MSLKNKIIITGGAGFIGSQLALHFIKKNIPSQDIVLFDLGDHFQTRRACAPLRKAGVTCLEYAELPKLLPNGAKIVFHMGAISNTDERDKSKLDRQNVEFSKELWEICREKNIHFIYASSASTYGAGEFGFDDDPAKTPHYKPLNLYAKSKQEFDMWVLDQVKLGTQPARWAGLKFFNVYGPGEEHKGKQASVIWTAKDQLLKNGFVKLFKSHNPKFADGEQARDFVYVGDVCETLDFFANKPAPNGIYNLGYGKARTFNDLVAATAKALGVPCKIEYIPTPENLREHYQYFTEARLDRLRTAGYTKPMTDLERGVKCSLELDREL